jgi:hypothetical protein
MNRLPHPQHLQAYLYLQAYLHLWNVLLKQRLMRVLLLHVLKPRRLLLLLLLQQTPFLPLST